jgi:hypothetical protein
MRRFPFGAFVVLLLAGCDQRSSQPADEVGGTIGVEPRGYFAPEPDGPIRSPAGRWIEPGTRDELGYVLPLDVRWPRADRPRPPAPSPRSRPPRGTPFEEHMLGPDDGHTQNETTIDAQADTLVAGWNNYTASTLVMGVARSTDGGHTWTNDLFSGHNVMSDPAVKAGGNGKWYYAYLAGGGAGGSDIDIFVRRSLDAGATWQAPVVVTVNASFDDKPYLDARGDEVLVAWTDFAFSPAKVHAARSLDGGISFGPAATLANNSVGGNGACPVIDRDGSYYVFWRDSFQDSLWVSKSTDEGATWSPDRGIVPLNPLPSSLPGGFRIVNFPSADAHPVSGEIVVTWNDQALGNPDILSIRSTDGASTWSAPVRVNDDAGTTAQFFPWLDFDEAGAMHVVWYDRRADGFDIDVYYARSNDGGATYEANTVVTPAPFTPVLPWDTTVDFIGDYNGIAATAGAAFPFYQDSRNGDQDVFVSIIPSPVTGVVPTSSAPDGAFPLLASPNPFRTQVRLEWTGRGDRWPIEIVGVDGRRRAILPGGAGPTVTWDGRDDAGRELPAGVYFARARGRAATSVRIVKVP